jgi:hypothetical protein
MHITLRSNSARNPFFLFLTSTFLYFNLITDFSFSAYAFDGNSSSSGFAPVLGLKKIERDYFINGIFYKCEIYTHLIKIYKNETLVKYKEKKISKKLLTSIESLADSQQIGSQDLCDQSELQDYVFLTDKQIFGCLKNHEYIFMNQNTKSIYFIVKTLDNLCK